MKKYIYLIEVHSSDEKSFEFQLFKIPCNNENQLTISRVVRNGANGLYVEYKISFRTKYTLEHFKALLESVTYFLLDYYEEVYKPYDY